MDHAIYKNMNKTGCRDSIAGELFRHALQISAIQSGTAQCALTAANQ